MSGSDRRGEGIRQALAGEQPVKPGRHIVEVEPMDPGPVPWPAWLFVAGMVCGLLALGCLYLVVVAVRGHR